MKRILFLLLIIGFSTCADAQRYVFNMKNENGHKVRVDTRRMEKIEIQENDDSVTANTYDGQTVRWATEDFNHSAFEKLPPRIVNTVQTIENDYVHRFITETTYDLSNYEYTEVLNYADHTLALDRPNPMVITIANSRPTGNEYVLVSRDSQLSNAQRMEFDNDSVKIWNATPGDTLYYRIMSGDKKTIVQEGMIHTVGQVRMIYAPSVNNIRDLGGWPVEGGGHIRYGRIFRGAKFHDSKEEYLSKEDSIRLRELNIKCEFDLRGGTEAGGGITANYYSRLGRDIDYRINGHGMYAYVNAVAVYPEYFRYGWNMIRSHILFGDPMFVHCSHGCDRMGTWAAVIEGVLGVSENDINLDYELSAFAPKSSLWRYRNMHQTVPDYDFRETMNYLRSLPGDTFKVKCEHFLVNICRIPKADIDKLREELIVK